MKKLYAAAVAIGLAILGIAASRALLSQAPAAPTDASVNVTQYHNNPSRDGLFIDPAFTLSAAANLARDVNFDGTIVGNVYAQPLYVEGGPDNRAKVIATTESNNVYALDAITGTIIWQRNVGTPSGSMGLISTVGITGTPVIDLASRSLILLAVISGPNNMVYSLNVDTGAINPGFPIDVNASFPDFSSSLHMQRGALTLLGNMVYVPYGGYADQGSYHGRVLGISLDGTQLGSWVTTSLKSGIWNPGGIASDGTSLFVVTGNAPGGTTPWGGSEAVIRLQPGPVFSGSTTDFWAPTNWQSLDTSDTDLGGSNAIILDVHGAIPSALVVAIGKDRNGYLLDRANLGGVSAPVTQGVVSSGQVINSPATYRTSQGTYVVLRPPNGTLTTFKITATSPPTITTGWTVTSAGRTSPFVTSTDGTSNAIVWAYGHGANQRLFGYNGDTGAVIFAGGGANDTISGTRTFNTGIAARGRIYIAGDNKVYAFSVPTGVTPTPSPTPTPSSTSTPSSTTTPAPTPTATCNPSPTCPPPCFQPGQCGLPCICPTPTPTRTPTPTPTPTPSPTPSPTPAPTPLNLSIFLPVATVNTATTNFTAPVTASTISGADNLIGFQGDFTFDQTVVTFQSPPASADGLTATNWNVSTNVLPGGGPIRTLRISAFSSDGKTPLSGSGTLFTLNLIRVSSTPGAATSLIWAAAPNDLQFFNTDTDVRLPNNTPVGSITVSSATVSISGNIPYCSNPSLNPVPGVTMTLTGSGSSSTTSDGSGNYTFAGLTSGGSYTVTPSKSRLTPGSAGINTVDVLAVQRHYLVITPIPSGCRLTAADVNGDTAVTTVDVIAIQRFFLSFAAGTANVGNYIFNPTNRSYPGLSGDQTAQNYDALVLGDVASGFVHRPK